MPDETAIDWTAHPHDEPPFSASLLYPGGPSTMGITDSMTERDFPTPTPPDAAPTNDTAASPASDPTSDHSAQYTATFVVHKSDRAAEFQNSPYASDTSADAFGLSSTWNLPPPFVNQYGVTLPPHIAQFADLMTPEDHAQLITRPVVSAYFGITPREAADIHPILRDTMAARTLDRPTISDQDLVPLVQQTPEKFPPGGWNQPALQSRRDIPSSILPDESVADYVQGVGQVFQGYGDVTIGAAEGIGHAIANSWTNAKDLASTIHDQSQLGLDTLVPTLEGAAGETAKDIGRGIDEFGEKLSEGDLRAAGQLVGTALTLPVAELGATRLAEVANLGSKVAEIEQAAVDAQKTKLSELKPERKLSDSEKVLYRRVKQPKGFREEVWEGAKAADGNVYDPTGRILKSDEPWQLGHKPAKKFSDDQVRAAEEEWDRQTWIKYQGDPTIYRPELPSTNSWHLWEIDTDW